MSEQKTNRKKVIFFDLNGTLIKRKKSAAQAFREALAPYLDRWDSDDKPSLINKACKIYSHAIRQFKKKSAAEVDEKIRKAAIKRAIANLPLSRDDAVISSIDRELQLIMSDKQRFDRNHLLVLKKLKKHYKLALITNGSESVIRHKVKRYRLSPLISDQAIFVSSKLGKGKGKPDPAIFRHALSRMKVKPEEAVMVGDSWKQDIEGAVRCGIDAVWVNPSEEFAPVQESRAHVIVIRDISELEDIY
jgi:putative hydrolase of the HAD superfamily